MMRKSISTTCSTCLVALLTFLVGCEDRQSGEKVAQYKTSLQLENTALSYREVMSRIVEERLQVSLELIARHNAQDAFSIGKVHGDLPEHFHLALESAVRIENLLRRADWSMFKSRKIDPSGFDRLVNRSLDQADQLARAAVGQNVNSTQRAADQLLSLCQSCHENYR
jgi:Cytochrome C'